MCSLNRYREKIIKHPNHYINYKYLLEGVVFIPIKHGKRIIKSIREQREYAKKNELHRIVRVLEEL